MPLETADKIDGHAETEPAGSDARQATEAAEQTRNGPERTVSVGLRSVVVGALVALLVVVMAATILLWLTARNQLRERDAIAAAEKQAEKVASEYAVGASNIDYQNFDDWVRNLKSNTSPALANKFELTAPQLKEIVLPLKWTSNATPIAAAVKSEDAGVYVVNVFLSVTSTSAQTPEGAQTTVTYTVTLDKNADWKVTDVGGIDTALPAK
ncbi:MULTISPECIES: hypothetical protein [Nocardia]|uniref:hypothetical protein n=1 Tax=Nocardia TaxID=1817 RepID=UPI001E580081|nr:MULTISPECIES: hypothetical protein [Nocardia]